jgi:AraC family transcriptional regulator
MGESFLRESVQINPPSYPLKGLNSIVSSLRSSVPAHEHCLPTSLKCVMSGVIDVETRRGRYRITPGRFVVINAWEPYQFSIPQGRSAQTFSLFFRPYYLPEILKTAKSGDDGLLDGSGQLDKYLEIPEALMCSESFAVGVKARCLFRLWQRGASQLCLADRLREVATAVVRLREGLGRQRWEIEAKKQSTRDELFRRVQRAYVFIRENYRSDIDLHAIAREVGMADHHLHRTFSTVFHTTPHQTITHLRLQEARRLVLATEIPLAAIGRRVGYASAPSFSNLFRATFGVPPSALRQPPARCAVSGD